MYYVYILKSKKDGNLYTGHTDNLDRRLSEHNSGKVKSTAGRRPFELVHIEEFESRPQARWREQYLKTASGKKILRRSL